MRMNRTVLWALSSLLWVAGVLPAVGQAGEADRPPNIVFLVADDLGWNDVGWRGSEIKTPRLDELAREGVILDQHYVTPMCSSTRAGLLSGRYPSRYGVYGATNRQVYPPGTVTLASALKSRGYFTAITGKWHLGSKPEWGPTKYGFDRSYGSLAGGVDQYTHFYKDGPYRRTWHRDDQFVEEEGHATDLIAREAIRWIESEPDGPFYIQVSFTAVHIPLQEPREWLRLYDGEIDHPSRRLFAACASHMDDTIGQIVDALDRTDQRDDTLIIFISDNGGSSGWTATQQYGGGHLPCPVLADNRPLRGWKGQLYEGGIRVPAFVHWPARLEPGTLDAPTHVVDWMPTLTSLAGYEPEDDLMWDGRNVWPLIAGHASESESEPRTMYWASRRSRAVRHGDWKLIVSADGDNTELFNLAEDPNETEDRADDEPQRATELKTLLEHEASQDDSEMP